MLKIVFHNPKIYVTVSHLCACTVSFESASDFLNGAVKVLMEILCEYDQKQVTR